MIIDHIGYLVRNIEKAAAQLQNFGFETASGLCYDESRDADILFLENDGYRVELVAPRSEKSIVWKLLKNNGAAPYHICYESESLEEDLERFTVGGTVITAPPSTAPALDGRRVAFLYSRQLGVIEFVETKANNDKEQ